MTRAHAASAAIVVSAASLLVALPATQAFAASWRPTWTWSSATKTANITLNAVKIQVATHLWVHNTDPRVKGIVATASGPGGAKFTAALRLDKGNGNTTEKGTWRGSLTLPPESPAGTWKVGYTATSAKGQTSGHGNAATFTITKTPPAALSAWPAPVVVGAGGGTVNVQAFWGRHVDGAYVALTAPGAQTITANLARVGGTPNWGLWKTSAALPSNSRPGTWKISTQYVSGGTWSAGPATTITVDQHTSLSLAATPTTVKAGNKVTLTGKLGAYKSDGNWSGLPGQKVTVWFLWHAAGAVWTKFTTATTSSTGNYTVTPYVARSGTFRLQYAGSGLFTGTTSRTVYITVK